MALTVTRSSLLFFSLYLLLVFFLSFSFFYFVFSFSCFSFPPPRPICIYSFSSHSALNGGQHQDDCERKGEGLTALLHKFGTIMVDCTAFVRIWQSFLNSYSYGVTADGCKRFLDVAAFENLSLFQW